MKYMSVGDMAQSYQMRRHNVQLKTHLTQLTREMTSGVKADLGKAVSGDFLALAGIDRSLRTLTAFKTATDEAAQLSGVMQEALQAVQDVSGTIGPTLLTAATTVNETHLGIAAQDARQKFLAAATTLNVDIGGRYVFAGVTSDIRPFAGGEDMLASLQTAIAAETTAAGVATAVAGWFTAPPGGGGFRDLGYLGSDTALAPLRLGTDEVAELQVTGLDPAIGDVLQGLALAAVIADGALGGNTAARSELARRAGETILGAQGPMAGLRARIGTAEAQIEQAAVRNGSERSALELARGRLTGAYPYETASALEAVSAQMETLYTLTARLSRLKFTDYI